MSRRAIAIAAAIAVCAGIAAGAFALTSFGAKSASSRVDHIGVQGHWQIVVKSPDGRIVTVRRFHNDPITAGAAIASILTNGFTPSGFRVVLFSNGSPASACGTSSAAACNLEPAGSSFYDGANANTFKTMSQTVSGNSIVLKGSVTAQRDGQINVVQTDLLICSASVAPATNCASNSFFSGFTQRVLSGADVIPLVNGQQVLVTVTLTFG